MVDVPVGDGSESLFELKNEEVLVCVLDRLECNEKYLRVERFLAWCWGVLGGPVWSLLGPDRVGGGMLRKGQEIERSRVT